MGRVMRPYQSLQFFPSCMYVCINILHMYLYFSSCWREKILVMLGSIVYAHIYTLVFYICTYRRKRIFPTTHWVYYTYFLNPLLGCAVTTKLSFLLQSYDWARRYATKVEDSTEGNSHEMVVRDNCWYIQPLSWDLTLNVLCMTAKNSNEKLEKKYIYIFYLFWNRIILLLMGVWKFYWYNPKAP